MTIFLKKFGTTLISRQAGKESFAALQPNLVKIKPKEHINIDFEGVITFSPSWGDEFLTPLAEKYGSDRIILKHTENPSVDLTLQLLEKIHKIRFHKD